MLFYHLFAKFNAVENVKIKNIDQSFINFPLDCLFIIESLFKLKLDKKCVLTESFAIPY